MAAKEFDETTLTVQAIQDYQVCSLFYDYRYQQHEHENILARSIIADRFENTLKKVASFFFYKKQDNITPSYNALLNRWEKLWYPKETDAYSLSIEQHETVHGNISSYTTAAAAALMQFHEDFSKDPGIPIMIDEKFLIPINHTVRLQGRIDLLLRYKDIYKVIKWSGRQRRPSNQTLVMEFAAQKLAFDYRNDKKKQVVYSLYDLGSTRPGFVPMEPSVKDVNALVYWANDIDNSEVYVPRRGYTSYCRGCPFDESCANFEFPSMNGGD